MQPVIRHSCVSFPRNAKPKVSASFQECGDSGTWTILYLDSKQLATFLTVTLNSNNCYCTI